MIAWHAGAQAMKLRGYGIAGAGRVPSAVAILTRTPSLSANPVT